MPTFKHPCPHCAKYIARDVATCPYCGTADPFAPARCPNCRAIVEDPAWAACPKCGQPLLKPAAAAGPAQQAQASPTPGPAAAAVGQVSATTAGRTCTGCGAPLAQGARFCTVCGTLAA